jgi:DNA-binding NarL/FixJ family response regulator
MPATVLITEKNRLFLEVLKGILSSLGFSVVGTTSNEFDIEALVIKAKPDLLVYDIQLSRDGMRLTDLKNLRKQLPLMKILVTGFYEATDPLNEEILFAGFDGFFSKSGNRDELIKKLKVLFP